MGPFFISFIKKRVYLRKETHLLQREIRNPTLSVVRYLFFFFFPFLPSIHTPGGLLPVSRSKRTQDSNSKIEASVGNRDGISDASFSVVGYDLGRWQAVMGREGVSE
jgi:hypothetical protein